MKVTMTVRKNDRVDPWYAWRDRGTWIVVLQIVLDDGARIEFRGAGRTKRAAALALVEACDHPDGVPFTGGVLAHMAGRPI